MSDDAVDRLMHLLEDVEDVGISMVGVLALLVLATVLGFALAILVHGVWT